VSEPPTVAVVGSGLAAEVASRLLSESGVEVRRLRASGSDISSIWSGYGSIFGPAARVPQRSAGSVERRDRSGVGFTADRGVRWQRLRERRGSSHPYARLDLDRPDLRRAIRRAISVAPDGLFEFDETTAVRPGPRGAPAAPDLYAPSLGPLELSPGMDVALLRAPTVDGWQAELLADQIGRADNLRTDVVRVSTLEGLSGGHPVRAARALASRVSPAEPVRRALEAAGADLLVVPPIFGTTVAEHDRWWSHVERAAESEGMTVAESPAARDSIFGWRLDRALRSDDLPVCESVVADREGASVRSPDLDGAPLFDAALLATGRWFGGGIPREAPMVEPLTEAPIWLDGEPLSDNESLYPPDFLDEHPWDDHALFRAGLSVDEHLRIRDRSGRSSSRLYAAGRLLAGFNPFHDGCALGVELATAVRAVSSLQVQFDLDPEPRPSA